MSTDDRPWLLCLGSAPKLLEAMKAIIATRIAQLGVLPIPSIIFLVANARRRRDVAS